MGRRAKRRRKSNAAATPATARPRPAILRWVGWPLALVGTFAVLCNLRSVTWTVWIAARYTEGRGRVVSSGVEGNYPHLLIVRHEVEGQPGRGSNNTEMDTPEYYDRTQAEERLAKCYPVGAEMPCYYDANDPNGYSVLVYKGLQLGRVLGVFAACLGTAIVGWWCVAKGTNLKTLPAPDPE